MHSLVISSSLAKFLKVKLAQQRKRQKFYSPPGAFYTDFKRVFFLPFIDRSYLSNTAAQRPLAAASVKRRLYLQPATLMTIRWIINCRDAVCDSSNPFFSEEWEFNSF